MIGNKKTDISIKLKPFVKWPGGKEKELKFFSEFFPEDINNYIEPFVGGGAVFFEFYKNSITGKKYINDFSSELISLYTYIKTRNSDFYSELDSIVDNIALMNEYAEDTNEIFVKAFYKGINNQDYSTEINNIIKKR